MSTRVTVGGAATITFLDDAERTLARNGKAATAGIMSRVAALLNQIAHQGRPWFTFIYNSDSLPPPDPAYRQAYCPMMVGSTTESGLLLYVTPFTESTILLQSIPGQGVKIEIDGTEYLTVANYDTVPVTFYPENLREMVIRSSAGYLDEVVEATISSMTDNGPQMMAATLWQDAANVVDPSNDSVVGKSEFHSKGNIVAVRSSGVESIGQMLFVYRNAAQVARPQMGWSARDPGGTGLVDFTVSPQNYRYIFNQAYGAGGTAITTTTPAMTLPLGHAGVGTRAVVRVYVFVYASMSGATDDGEIGVANKMPDGTMDVPHDLQNMETVSGTTFAWYPSLASFDPETSPYFDGYAGSASPFDRVALCARSTGATDTVRIGAFTYVVMHSTAF